MLVFSILMLLVVVIMLLYSINNNRGGYLYKFLFFTLFCILLIVSGCRGLSVGTDTAMFVRVFKNISSLWSVFHLYSGRFEIGYLLFNYIIKCVVNSPNALLFFSSFVTLLLIFYFFNKKSLNPIFSVFLFVSLMFFSGSMCLLRQYLAISLSCISIIFLSENKNIKFFVFVLFAYFFHSSSLVLLVLFPLSKLEITNNNKKKFIILSFIMVLFSSRLIITFFNYFSHYSGYLYSDKYYLQNKLGSILKCILQFMIFIFININYNKGKNQNEKFHKICYLCSLLSAFISLAAIQGAIISRMATYFSIVNCVTLPNTVNSLEKPKDRMMISFIIISISLLYYFVILIFRPYWSGVIPYSFM